MHGVKVEHNDRQRVNKAWVSINWKINQAKCILVKSDVNNVDHLLNGEGLKPTPERVRAITGIREPCRVGSDS